VPPTPRIRTAAPTTYKDAVLADSPLVYYRLDEAACCNAADSSGNARSGTYASAGITYGAASLLTPDTDAAISTSGAGAALTRDPAFLPSTGPRTVEIWAQTTAGGAQTLFSYGQTNANTQYFQFSIRNGSQLVFLGWGDDMVFGTPYPVNDGRPHHYALAYDGGTLLTFFLDGQQIGQGGLGAPLATTTVGVQPLAIGNGVDGPFVGTLDEAAIYGAALSPAQLNAQWRAGSAAAACPAAPTAGYAGSVAADQPLRYFRLGDSTGAAATDFSAGCRYAAYAPSALRVAGLLKGDGDGAVANNPAALTTIVSASADGLPSTGPRSVEVWAQTSSAAAQSLLSYGQTNANTQYFQLSIRNGNQLVFMGWGDDMVFGTPYPINDGKPHQVALTYDGGTLLTFFVDGQQIGQGGLGGPLQTGLGAQGLWLGNGVDGVFQGTLDEFAFYPSVLGPDRVNAHWRAGTAAAACPGTPAAGYPAAVAADHPFRQFRLGEAGQAAVDLSGNCHYAAYAPAAPRVPGLITGDNDLAVGSPTPPTTVVSASTDGLPTTGARTVEIWAQTTAAAAQTLFSYGQTNANTQYFQFSIRNGNQLVFMGWGDDAVFGTPYPINDGHPHHYALSYDGTGVVTFFLDGQQIGQAGLGGPLHTSLGAQGLWLGSGVDGPFLGTLDEAAVYLTALIPDQVNSHWRAGIGAAACPAAILGAYAASVVSDQPLRYFRLGDSTGAAATDLSAGCRYAAYAPSALRVAGLLKADGDGAVANDPATLTTIVSASAGGLPSTGPRSVELWAQTSSTAAQALLSYGRTNANTQYFQLSIRGGNQVVFMGWGDDMVFGTPYPINDGNPHQVALTYDGGTLLTFFLDGQQIGQGGLGGPLQTALGAQGLWLGNGVDGVFQGTLDEFAFYPSVLGPDRVNAHWRAGTAAAACPGTPATGYPAAVAADHPFRQFRLGEAGQAAVDLSGNCHYAAYAPAAPRVPGLITGDNDLAVGNPTPPSTVVSASTDGLPTTGPRTVEIWAQTTAAAAQTLFSYGQTNANTQYFQFSIRNGNQLVFMGWGDDAVFGTPYPINDGHPHHYALSYDGTGVVTFYLDGQQIGQAGLGGPLHTSLGAQGLWLGVGVDGPFVGTLDEAAVYLTALTPDQVNSHWRAGTAAVACPSAPTTRYAGAIAADHPLHYFTLSDAGQAATDFSGNCRYGAFAPGVGHVSGLLSADPGGAVSHTSAPATMVSISGAGLPTTGARTFELWEETVSPNSQALFSYGQTNANTQYFQLSLRNGNQVVFIGWGDDAVFAAPYPLNDGTPHHLAVAYDGGRLITVYVDGMAIGQAGLGAPLSTSLGAQALELGTGVDGPFVGALEHFAVYNSALSGAQIGTHYIVAQQQLTQGVILGTVTYKDAGGTLVGVPGAKVSATMCVAPGLGCTTLNTTASVGGSFRFTGLAFGSYQLGAFPGPNTSVGAFRPGYANATVAANAALAVANISMTVVVSSLLPPNVTMNGQGGTPTLFWGSPTTVNVTGCTNGIGVIVFSALNQTNGRQDLKAVPLFETPAGSGKYVATVPPFYPDHGSASGQVSLQCPPQTAVLPADGPATGGTTVRISGQGLSGTQAVLFGNTPAQSFQVISDTLVLAVAPPGTGNVQISLSGTYGTIACNPLLNFTYLSVTGVTPTSGPVPAGGVHGVTITGTGFQHMAGVYFGTVKSAVAVAVSDNEIIASVPAGGTGTVDVRVVTAGGSSPATSADLYNFDAPTNSGSSATPAPNNPPSQCPPPASAAVSSWDAASILAVNSAVAPPTFSGNSTVAAPDPFWSALIGGAAGGVDTAVDGASAISDALNKCDGGGHDSTLACALTYYGQIQPFWDIAQNGQEDKVISQFLSAVHDYQTALAFGNQAQIDEALKNLNTVEKFVSKLERIAGIFKFLDVAGAVLTPFTLAALFDQDHLGPFIESKLGLPPGSAAIIGALIGAGYGLALILGFVCVVCDVVVAGVALGLFLYDSHAVSHVAAFLDSLLQKLGLGTPFAFLIDPSGNVLTTAGAPVAGATVNLLAGPTASGPFSSLPVESGLLAPAVNPETTDAGGNFHWDVAPGFYEVSASAPGCSSATSSEFPIPPPAVGIVLTLLCPGLPGPAPPTVSGLSLTSGPAAGGEILTISGTNFTPGSTVSFGGRPATSLTFISPNALQVVAPSGSGTIDVVVNNGAASGVSAADQFSFLAVPAVVSMAPIGGLITGGALVDVRGSGFTPASTVLFGDVASPYVVFVSSTELQALSPARAAGTVDVTVRTLAGVSAVTPADQFAYRPLVASPSLATVPKPASVVVGGVLNDAATLTGGFNAGGTVTFNLFGPGDPTCSGTPVYSETDPVSGAATATGAGFASNTAGTWNWTAAYSGDAANTPAGSGCGTEPVTVTRATPALVTSTAPATVAVGGALNDTAVVTGGFAPAGSVVFSLFAPGDSACATPVATEPDAVIGRAAASTLGFASNAVGTWQWTASYSGDANNNPAGTACGAEPVIVSKASPALSTAPSPATVVVGGALGDTATLAGGYKPGGTVTFKLFGPGDPTCALVAASSETDAVAAAGSRTLIAFSTDAAGTWHWIASYSGDANNNPAAGACADEAVAVTRATPTLSSTATGQAFLGDPLVDVAHLGAGFKPTGTITFQVFGPQDPACAKPLSPAQAPVAVSGDGDLASGAVVATQVGRHRWIASYSGDAKNNSVATGCGDPGETSVVVRHGYITDGECTFDVDPRLPGQQLALQFDPHKPGTFKLTSTQPEQVFYNTVEAGTSLGGTTLTISLPYPWITSGKVALEIYDSVKMSTDEGQVCLEPGERIGTSSAHVALKDYPGKFGTTASLSIVLPKVPNLTFVFVRVRLEYGLRGETGCRAVAPGKDAACTTPEAVTIADGQAYSFSDTGFNVADISSVNSFQRDNTSDVLDGSRAESAQDQVQVEPGG
jgi:hypothetical protein